MNARDPKVVLADMRGAFQSGADSKSKVIAVRDAMLTPRERELIAGAPRDERADGDFDRLALTVGRLLSDADWRPPDAFWSCTHYDIGNLILRRSEIDLINAAHDEGRFDAE